MTDPTRKSEVDSAIAAVRDPAAPYNRAALTLAKAVDNLRRLLGVAVQERDQAQAELESICDVTQSESAVRAENNRLEREIADLRAALARTEETAARVQQAYELKVADLAKETKRVSLLAKVLMDDNHSPDGFHAEGDRCRHCKALREALRPGEALAADAPAAPITRDGGDCTATIHGPACNGIHAPAASEPDGGQP